MMSLTSDQIENFHTDGFLAVQQAIDADTLARLQQTVQQLLDRSREITQSDKVFELEVGHNAQNPRLCRVSHPVAEVDLFWDLATSDAILDCVESLIGPNIKFHHSKLNFKVAQGGVEIGWHQDFAFFPHTNYDLVACGIALEDATLDNGCLMGIPGTHHIGILNHCDEQGEFTGKICGDAGRYDVEAAQPIELKAGDMSMHHAHVIHGSAQNQSPQSRPLLIFQYAACDAIALDRRPPANKYSERVVRGEPATHARLAEAVSLPLRGDMSNARSIFERQHAVAQ